MVPAAAPRPPLSRTRIRVAWGIALAVDAIQIPVEVTGPVGWLLGVGLDVVTMVVLWAMLGFHWAFLPSFLTEWIPYLNLAPFWTLAVALATRGRGDAGLPLPTEALK
ncbi:MAG: hypothetical protein HXX12_13270 [Geothrix sp.]|uniref:hypothetical protein n=1 Tax=Geothrix sp. TaxID=1962974 RepID=UPI001797972C|nr:hypothetical protein [Geothrix sp.]NWJ41926.1 hypothetical protein [Geothrix sp.]WIL20101.1 MAG: hypothetical protein QOZ81_002645 [Geothrix sp.]